MHGLAKLPILPESAIRGLPASTELFTPGLRRFYAFTLAAALAGERSWVIVVHPGWRLGEQRVRHIMQAGWPAIGNPQAVAVIQPAPLPQDPEGLFQRAGAGAGALGPVIGPLLATLWAGEWPADPGAEVEAFLGEVIFQAGLQAAAEAKAAAAGVALAA
jgi:hypothetical protein